MRISTIRHSEQQAAMGAREALSPAMLLAVVAWLMCNRQASATDGLTVVTHGNGEHANKLRALMAEALLPPPDGPNTNIRGTAPSAASIMAILEESSRLQTAEGDLITTFQGYDTLARIRRGEPWPSRQGITSGSDMRFDSKCAASTSTDGRDLGAGHGDSGGGGGGGERGGGYGDSFNACVYSEFLERHNETTRLFAARANETFAALMSGADVPSAWAVDPLVANSVGNLHLTAVHKLDHDLEQLQYLMAKKRLPKEFEDVVLGYKSVRAGVVEAIKATVDYDPTKGIDRSTYYGMGPEQFERLRGTYNSLLYVPPGPSAASAAAGVGMGIGGDGGTFLLHQRNRLHPTGFKRVLNPNLDWNAIETAYTSQDAPLVSFDGFLLPEALEGILEYCREATVFFEVKPGYLGAYLNEGFTSPWLIQLAYELQERLPKVLEGMTLSNMWAYKFDSDFSMEGTTVHADGATVNLNFWVTPDDANLDPSSGGLVVYPKVPPNRGTPGDDPQGDVDMSLWNNWSKKEFVKTWLRDEGALDRAVRVPYRQNRVVMFDSRLLHETDAYKFRQGYENRRINLTLLFSPATASST